tara:strand:+ start:248 stop:412 length:165 start_codon:yes stop_codon:yes gene_type:complete
MNKKTDKQGLLAGYKPNRISLYLIMLQTGRHTELKDMLYTDMEKYKIKDTNDSK